MGETMLVTGGCGFIGSCFVLRQKGWRYGALTTVYLDGWWLFVALSCSCQGDAL